MSIAYDVVGIGIGPFNLGLACLLDEKKSLKKIFFDKKVEFNWHEGIMPKGSTLQIPFIADLVTLADPTNRFSFLNYLKQEGRLHRFYIYENFYIAREEYNRYCKWVAHQQADLRFNKKVELLNYDRKERLYRLEVLDQVKQTLELYSARNLVIGTGRTPIKPEFYRSDEKTHCLVSEYSYRKDELRSYPVITVVGSGQSGAEVFFDLLQGLREASYKLHWIGRSSNFFAMDLNKLALEVTTPDYGRFFYGLPKSTRNVLLRQQDSLYKGVNRKLLNAIYDYLFENQDVCSDRVVIYPGIEVFDCQKNNCMWQVFARSMLSGKTLQLDTSAIIMALGYEYVEPVFLRGLGEIINRNEDGEILVSENYSIDKEETIFVQNVGLKQHGIVTPDLSMGPYRNSSIANQLLGSEYYSPNTQVAYQQFL